MPIKLRYGLNPHQAPAELVLPEPPPLRILNGIPSYINILDAIGAWRLVHELYTATNLPSAASFKHTSPAGAAITRPLSETYVRSQMLPQIELSPVAIAYARARGGDRMSSYGDAVAVSHNVDITLASLLKREVSDLIIAPSYDPDALELLKEKKQGRFLILQIDPEYTPPPDEERSLFGFKLRQKANDLRITADSFSHVVTETKGITNDIIETLIVAAIALKYTQSNSVCIAYDGQVIGMGAGQQSRINCTRLACDKADKWLLQRHPKLLTLPFKKGVSRLDKINVIDRLLTVDKLSDAEASVLLKSLEEIPELFKAEERAEWIKKFNGVCLVSDAYIPFRDNVDRAHKTNVQYIAETGGSVREDDVILAAQQYGMTLIHTEFRLFLH